jgi:glycosyltransferase involved in cell wall biosynthesis
MSKTPKYVLMTAAKDEADFIGLVIESVAKQTLKPIQYVIVDDGSKDSTEAIIRQWVAKTDFVRLKTKAQTGARNFGSKVVALKAAQEEIQGLDFEFIGCLDADITLPPDYYESIIRRMRENPKLGIASGLCLQKSGGDWIRIMTNRRHVPGAMQFFRRACFEQIGGYERVTVAGVDSLAEIKARMRGWETRSFEDIFAYHHKPIGSATGGKLKTAYRRGMTDYLLGKHPLYVLAKCVRRVAARPYFADSAAHLSGFFSLWLKRKPMDVSPEVCRYVRHEGLQALKHTLCHGQRPG